MATRKPLVLNGGQIQRLQAGDYFDTSGLFDPTSNLGGINGLATNGLTVHNGTAFTTVTLTEPAAGMTITNANGVAGSPTFAFTGELSALIGLSTGIVAKTASGTLAARTITGTTNQITIANGDGVSGNPTISLAANPVIPGNASVTVPVGTSGERPTGTSGMVRYSTTANKFEFYENGAWVNYGTSNSVGTVTSVDVTMPTDVFSNPAGPITTAGSLDFSFNTQLQNLVFASPDALTGTPTFRALVANDIPNLPWSKITSGTPTTLAGYGITDAVPNSRQVIAGTGLSGGGALTADVTISMPNVGTAVTGQFVKITTDAQGRVSATSAVGSSDITTSLGYTPVNKVGDSMSGNLTFTSGATVTGLPLTAVGSTDAASKAYVDNMVASGTTWRDPVQAPNLIDVVTAQPTDTAIRTQYIKFGGTQNETWTGTTPLTNVVDNDILEYNPLTDTWTRIGTLSAGDRFTVAYATEPVGSTLYAAGIRKMDLIQYVSGNPTSGASWSYPSDAGIAAVMYTADITTGTATSLAAATYTASISVNGTAYPISVIATAGMLWSALITEINTDLTGGIAVASIVAGHLHITAANPDHRVIVSDTDLFTTAGAGMEIRATIDAGTTVLVSNPLSADNGRTGLFSGGADGSHAWIEIGGPAAINAGIGLVYDGNTLNINMGAGIVQLPTDEVGIDLYGSASSALILTIDGTTRTTTTGAQLALLLNGSTLAQGISGLNVAAGGITATELNASVAGAGLAGGGGTALSVVTDGSSLEITGDSLNIKAGGVTAAMLATAVAGLGLTNTGTALDINVGAGALEIQTDVLNIKTGGVTNAMLATSLINLAGTSGTGTVSLGGTLTVSGSNGITTTASAGAISVALSGGLDNLSDVTLTSDATGDILVRNGAGQYVNLQPGATAGVQPYDATLAALAQLTTTSGMVVETGTDAFTTRVLQGTAGRVTVTDGDGIAGDPTIDLASGVVTAGTYSSVTVDTYGRVTAGSAVEASTQVAMTNANAGTLAIGTPVYVSVGGSVDAADAGAASTTRVIGLVADVAGIATTASGNVAVAGIQTATTNQWDVITGQTGGLTAGAVYFLDPGTPGKLKTTAASGAGEFVAAVGIALSTTKLKIQVDPTIQL